MSNDGPPILDTLISADPPRLGAVTLLGRLEATDAGIVYAGRREDTFVAAAMLSRGAELDSFARARFLQAIEEAVSSGALTVVDSQLDDAEISPWVAVPAGSWQAGLTASRVLLTPVALEHLGPVTDARGPNFRPHWAAGSGPGRWRIWPLPWPAVLASASRWSHLLAFALVVAIATLALFIAVKIFETQPAVPPPPQPQPTNQPSPAPTPTPETPSSEGPPVPPIV